MLEQTYPERRVQNACSTLACVNGRRRPPHLAEWDFTLGGQRVELKAAKLCFIPSHSTWRVSFRHVKLERDGARQTQPFDELYLLIYTPGGFYLVQHDLKTGVSKSGACTQAQGHTIYVQGRSGQTWQESLDRILTRLVRQGDCKLVHRANKFDWQISALYAELLRSADHFYERVYDQVPLNDIGPSLRALRVQKIAFEVDKMQNPRCNFTSASGEVVKGRRRGEHNAAVDWIRDGVRVEVKHAKARFDPGPQRWRCTFGSIKEDWTSSADNIYFDELWLAMYGPMGLDFFRHPEYSSRLASNGLRTSYDGKRLEVLGKRHELCVNAAIQQMKVKLEVAHAEHFCSIQWNRQSGHSCNSLATAPCASEMFESPKREKTVGMR